MGFKYKIMIAAVALSMLGTFYGTRSYYMARYEAQIAKHDQMVAQAHISTLNEVRKREQETRQKADAVQMSHYLADMELRIVRRTNAELSSTIGMCDPYATSGRNSTRAGDSTNTSNGTTQPGRLSEEASRFLLDFAEDADQVALYAWTCYRYLNNLD